MHPKANGHPPFGRPQLGEMGELLDRKIDEVADGLRHTTTLVVMPNQIRLRRPPLLSLAPPTAPSVLAMDSSKRSGCGPLSSPGTCSGSFE